jgi:exonuclease VII small subunit
MQEMSKALMLGSLEAIAEKMESKPTKRHQSLAELEQGNRRERRAAKAIKRRSKQRV